MVRLRLFASAREAAGTGSDEFHSGSVGEILDQAGERYGEHFVRLLDTCKVWCNGEPADCEHLVSDGDEIAVLPPVSGG